MIDAIILAGGFGTRLSQTLPHIPKALAPIKRVPFLDLLLEQLQASGIISKVVMALGYKAAHIETHVSQKSYSFPIEFSIEPTPQGTGGAIVLAVEKTTTNTLLILNGDSYFDLDLAHFLRAHLEKKGMGSIACREMEDTSRYGTLEIDPSDRIHSFREKNGCNTKGWINAGVYLMQKELFSSLPQANYSLEKELLPRFLEKKLFAYPHSGAFIDIGTPESYDEAQEILKPWIKQ